MQTELDNAMKDSGGGCVLPTTEEEIMQPYLLGEHAVERWDVAMKGSKTFHSRPARVNSHVSLLPHGFSTAGDSRHRVG